ncbi:MAG: Crp/Fnr family transcriptional regulator [Candidatus Rokuibacteriota bacterium]
MPYRLFRVPGGLDNLLVGCTVRASASDRQEEEDALSHGVKKPGPVRNRILAGLPRKEYARILPGLARVTLKAGQVLHEPGGSTQAAYFLDSATVSILSLARDGTSIEVSLVGDEGLIGLPIVLRSQGLPYRIIVQGPGTAWRMKADVLRKEFERCGPLHQSVLQYVHTLIVYLSQSSACNRFHTIRQRICRWLLISQDRARSGDIKSTQEFLSQILGVNRGSASQAASALQRAGLIRYRRGQIAILDRPGLEAAACECYRLVKGEFDRFFREPSA